MASIDIDPTPLILLGIGVVIIFVLILWLRVNAFLGMIIAAIVVGILSPKLVLEALPGGGTQLNLLNALSKVAEGFGSTMGKIGISIALATIIGKALMDSGAADRIVRAFTRLFGEKRASLALLLSGFVLSVPVFFDTVFFLLVPLAKALNARTRQNYLFYLMAIGAGGAITHSLVPPTPGPITMAENLRVDLGMVILIGTLVGAPLAYIGYLYGKLIDRLSPVEMRQVGDVTIEELEQQALRPDSELPSLFWSVLPIILPVIMITTTTAVGSLITIPTVTGPENAHLAHGPVVEIGGTYVSILGVLQFFGDPKIALLFAMIIALRVVVRQKKMNLEQTGEFSTVALTEAAMILLITSAGGAFGEILKSIGLGDELKKLADAGGISLLVLAWGMAVLFKVAQGSGTVAMVTTSSIVASMITPDLGYNPVFLVMAIGCGSLVGSWMNDSGFWVVAKLGGLTEREALRSWTVNLAVMGIAGLPLVWLLTKIPWLN